MSSLDPIRTELRFRLSLLRLLTDRSLDAVPLIQVGEMELLVPPDKMDNHGDFSATLWS